MEIIGTLSGGAVVMKRYQAGTSISNGGASISGAITAGTDLGSVEVTGKSTAPVVHTVGVNIDTTTETAIDATTGTDSSILVTVGVNPDAIIKAKMNTGDTEDTALAQLTPSSASSTGVTVNATALLNGPIWGYSGNNASSVRKCSNTNGAVAIAFDSGVLTTDRYLFGAVYPCTALASANHFWDLTANSTQVVSSTIITDTDNFVCLDLELRDSGDDGANNSFVHMIANRHLFGSSNST
jgi:hypothetical protein